MTEHVAIEPSESAESRVWSVFKDFVTANPHVDNGKIFCCGISLKPACQHTRPASVRVWSGCGAGSAGCAENHNGAGIGWRHDFHARNPEPGWSRRCACQFNGAGDITSSYVVRPQRRVLAR